MKRQGDLLFRKTENNISRLKVLETNIIELGETSGHAHTLEGGTLVGWQQPDYVSVLPNSVAVITHDEHAAIELEPGIWQIIRQREYIGDGEYERAYD